MTQFVQLHCLTFYPPSNLNRDDLGKPKSAMVGGQPRQRISSQCLKRTWRTSDQFEAALKDNLGVRTRGMGTIRVIDFLTDNGISVEDAEDWAVLIGKEFAEVEEKSGDKSKKGQSKQLVHFNMAEQRAIETLMAKIVSGDITLSGKPGKSSKTRKPMAGAEEIKNLDLRRSDDRCVDIAMFGRMLANFADNNVDAAVQVSHAFTVNKVSQEEDFFTAVDDINRVGDKGSGHMDTLGFGSGIFYLYLCINRDLLLKNLGGDEELVQASLKALTKAVMELAPSGKQNSFAAHSRCNFAYIEKGTAQPRSLSMAFIQPVRGADLLSEAVKQFDKTQKQLDTAYEIDNQAKRFYPFAVDDYAADLKTISDLANFVAEPA